MQKSINEKERQEDLFKLFWIFVMLLFVAIGFAAHTALGETLKAESVKPDAILLSAPNLYGKNFFSVLINSPDPKEAPKNLRTYSKEAFKEASLEISASEPEKLRISGSGEFSKGQLEFIISKINSDWEPSLELTKKIRIVDISPRAHGFVNNMQVEWLDKNVSVGSDEQSFYDQEKALLAGLRKTKKISIYTLPENKEAQNLSLEDILKLGAKRIQIQADAVETEAQYLKEKNISYTRMPIKKSDDGQIEDKRIEQLVILIKKIKKDEWLHFHSEDGTNKLSLILILADIFKSAQSLSLPEILNRQNFISRQAKLEPISTQSNLEKIYEYAKDQAPEYKISWSSWQKTHPQN